MSWYQWLTFCCLLSSPFLPQPLFSANEFLIISISTSFWLLFPVGHRGIPDKWSTKAGGICMGNSGRRQSPNGEILLLSLLVLSPEWPTQFWGKDGGFYCHLTQALGITHDAKHGSLPFSCAGERRGKTHSEEMFFIKSKSSSFCHAWRMQRSFTMPLGHKNLPLVLLQKQHWCFLLL